MNLKKLTFIIFTIFLSLTSVTVYSNQLDYAEQKSILNKNGIVLQFVESIIDNITHTRYQHDPQTHDLEKGIFFTNCSGFANFILKYNFPEVLESLDVESTWYWSGTPKPRAAAYHKAFIDSELTTTKAASFWQKIPKLKDAKPGDFIAYRENSFDENSNSGHVMIVAGYPYYLGHNTFVLEVIDASKYRHSYDSRAKNGIGKGAIKFYVDEFEQPIALGWTLNSLKRIERKIAIGRLK